MSISSEKRSTPITTTVSDSRSAVPREPAAPHGMRALAVLRILMGFVFLWAFADKAFGLGYATAAKNAWIAGGSPTKGFLNSLDAGPLQALFHGIAGAAWADWLFMAGLLGIGVGLLLGIAMRISAVGATAMMALMWAAEWPLARFTEAGKATASTNPLIDYHVVYAAVVIALALTLAGATWGLGNAWARLPIVQRHRWLI